MSNQVMRLAVAGADRYGHRQSKRSGVQRRAFDPTDARQLEEHGFASLWDTATTPSSGLHQLSAEQVQALCADLLARASDAAEYLHNTKSEYLYTHGHVYLYRSASIQISPEAVTFIERHPNRSMRLSVRTFPNGALELPPGTVLGMRESVETGTRDAVVLRQIRADPAIESYQRTQWDTQANLVGDVMLGRSSIVLNTRQGRHRLDGDRYIVDMINPATREFHTLDGSTMWLRMVDASTQKLVFAVLGTGRHHHSLMDAMNNAGAMGIWHYIALVQQHLYDDVPSSHDGVRAHIENALQKSAPVARNLHRQLTRMDREITGSFLRRLRRKRVFEDGDGYLDSRST